jgi:hypothetical protein
LLVAPAAASVHIGNKIAVSAAAAAPPPYAAAAAAEEVFDPWTYTEPPQLAAAAAAPSPPQVAAAAAAPSPPQLAAAAAAPQLPLPPPPPAVPVAPSLAAASADASGKGGSWGKGGVPNGQMRFGFQTRCISFLRFIFFAFAIVCQMGSSADLQSPIHSAGFLLGFVGLLNQQKTSKSLH